MKWTRFALVPSLILAALFSQLAEAAGVLVARDGSGAIRLRSQRVTAVVEDGVARTTVRQTFLSGREEAVEAIYTFPVPTGAALVDVAMETGGQRYEGLLAERQTARRTYDSLVRRKIDPAIVEQIGRDTFRLSVYPVMPQVETVVEMTWIETCPLVAGELRYVYPLALAGDVAKTEQDFTFSLVMRSAAPIVSCASASPAVLARAVSTGEVRASMEVSHAALDRDIVVTARVSSPEPSLAIKTFRGATGDGYFSAVVTPPDADDSQVLARDITLLFDTSGSMGGEKMEQARRSALYLVDHLRPRDAVNVILFSDSLQRFADAPVAADAATLERLRAFLRAAAAGGSTALGDALQAASTLTAREGRVAMTVLLTDGVPTVGVVSHTEICAFAKTASANGVRVFTFGVGSDVNAPLLEGVAAAGRGSSSVFRIGGETETGLRSFLTRTASPVLANLSVTIDGRVADDLYPRPLADLYLGEQAVLTGRAAPGKHDVVVRGIVAGREVELRGVAMVPEAPSGVMAVRDLYARQKLAFLEQALRLRSGLSDAAYFASLERGAYSNTDELVAATIALSLETGVQSPYTAFLVMLPEDRARINPRDAAALDGAAERAKAKRRETAGLPPIPATPPTAPEVAEAKPEEESERVVDDPVLKDAKVADHNETGSDDVGTDDSLGDPRFISDAPFEGPGTNGTIGIGGGGGGSFGNRRGGRRNLKAGGGGKKSVNAVDLGHEWSKRAQNLDGGWGVNGISDPETTGLMVLTFLGAGETHQSGAYKDQVKDGLKYLKSVQDPDGCIGTRAAASFHRAHLTAGLAMVEAYGLTQSVIFKDAAQRAVNFTVASQNPYAGWGLGFRDGVSDTMHTAQAVLLLRAAVLAGLEVDKGAFGGALAFLDRATDAKTGGVTLHARTAGSTSGATDPPESESLTCAAAATFARLLCLAEMDSAVNANAEATVLASAALLANHLPSADRTVAEGDPEYILWGALATFQAGEATWSQWSKALQPAVVATQVSVADAAEMGSWEPSPPFGRARTTGLFTLTMEVFYRYSRGFSRR